MRVGLAGEAPSTPQVDTAGLQVHVVSGMHAGQIFALPTGVHEIGRSAPIGWPDDPLLSRRHARLVVASDAVTIADLGSSNGTYLDGVKLEPDQPSTVAIGATLGVGGALLEVRAARPPDAVVEPGEPGWLDFVRPPRITDSHATPTIAIPAPPAEPAKRRFPFLMMLAPLLVGAVMVLVMRNLMYAAFMLLSPIMLVFNVISDRNTGRADYKSNLAKYEDDLARAQSELDDAVAAEKTWLRTEWPDAAGTLMTCLLPGRRLWERRPRDPDALAVRLGTTDIASTIKTTGASPDSDHRLVDVPVGVVLTKHPVLGLAGPVDQTDAALRWITAQLAAYHPTRDLTCSFVGVGTGDDWDWLQWLPHLRPERGDDGPMAYVATNEKNAAEHFTGLAAMVQARRDAMKGVSQGTRSGFPAHVLLIRDYHSVRGLGGLGAILDDGPDVGVYTVCTNTDEARLPEECTATLVFHGADFGRARLRRQDEPTYDRILVDGVSPQWCDLMARELSPLIDTGADDADSGLPSQSRLLEVIDLDPPTEQMILTRWGMGGRTTQAIIGEALEGPFAIDIRTDGPHGLVAGTTGAGKSELLQTIVASLAVGNRSDEMNFVLIDYKGGAAFKDCAHLPHTVGMVTDLDGHLTNRALESLGAELRRRERLLASAGAKDIEDYLEKKTPADPPMPRLLIIVDEFAALVQELPDFVTGLIDITRRGRSLGTHLILATQRPAGVVSAEIKSNTNLRIALRVTDVGDSTDVIDAPDAARIPKSLPGRGYARLGHSSLVGFQSSRIGGRPPGVVSDAPAWAWAYTTADLSAGPPIPPEDENAMAGTPTDLSRLVETISSATALAGYPVPSSPWLPPLPDQITAADILAAHPENSPNEASLRLPLGLTDLPARQSQEVATWSIADGANLAVVGMGRSGRSGLLRLIGATIGQHLSPVDVHIYVVDCGGNAMLPLVNLPHAGAVVTRDQPDRIGRLATLIQHIIAGRQQQLAVDGYADVTEQRAHTSPESRLPYIVILFDNWDIFTQVYDNYDGGALISAWQDVFQQGAAAGIRVVVTGDRSLLGGRMAAMFPDKLLLRLPDPSDYGVIGMSVKTVPSTVSPGRGFRAGGAVETQIALIAPDPAGTAQTAALHNICRDAKLRWADLDPTTRPPRVDVLPARFTTSQIHELTPTDVPDTAIPVAVGGDTLSLRSLDAIEHGPALLVTGPRRTGRSTVLVTMATFARRQGWNIMTITPRISPLRRFAASAQVFAAFEATPNKDEFAAALAGLRESPNPSIVLVDDIELITQDGWQADLLVEHIAAIRDTGSIFVGAGTPANMTPMYSGPVSVLKKSRSGVALSPQTTVDADLFSITLPRSALGAAMPPGGGYIVRAGEAERVQVIWPDNP